MKNFRSHFRFNKQERSGIYYLLLIIIVLQAVYFVVVMIKPPVTPGFEVDMEMQGLIDELKDRHAAGDTLRLYPFNPNYISDFKGYSLGMSAEEIDRLHQYRGQRKFVNSALEFQQVTLLSDSLLAVIAPFFRFPEWVREREATHSQAASLKVPETVGLKERIKIDLNTATLEELKEVQGIGDKLAARIIKFRTALGGFLVADQLYDVYGLPPDVTAKALQKFEVRVPPEIARVNLNTSSAAELARILYINDALANSIVAHREVIGGYKTFDELGNIADFPIEKIDRITLYLRL